MVYFQNVMKIGEIYPTIVDTIDVITSEYEKENKQKKQESR